MFGFLLVAQNVLATPDTDYSKSQVEAFSNLYISADAGLGDSSSGDIPFVDMDPAQIIGRIVGIGLSFIGVLFFGLLVYGGIKWMLAKGNDEEVKKAIDLIQATIFGLMVVLAAYAFTAFLSGSFMEK